LGLAIILWITSSFTPVLAQEEPNGDLSQTGIIRDYRLHVKSIVSEPAQLTYEAQFPGGGFPVTLNVKGWAEVNGRRKHVAMESDGMLFSHQKIPGASVYMQLFQIGNTLYVANNLYLSTDTEMENDSIIAIGSVDAEGNVTENDNWSFHIIYREYRYTLRDRLYALAAGHLVENREDLIFECHKK
jgi:hypothetical protein